VASHHGPWELTIPVGFVGFDYQSLFDRLKT
jgi:hypothetical protein